MNSLARQFLEKAEADFEVASFLLDAGKDPGIVCFHAQQAIEKLLKAALANRGVDPPRTHNLVQLSELLGQTEPTWRADVADLSQFAPAAVEYRYPSTPPSMNKVREMLALAAQYRASLLPYCQD